MKRSTQLILAVCMLANLAVWAWVYRTHEAPDWTGTAISGVSFSPYEAGQDPEFGDEPEEATIKRDLIQLKGQVRRVRTYSVLGTLGTVPQYAGELGLTVTAGAWIDTDQAKSQTEVDTLIRLANRHINIERVLVGNEALLRKDITTSSLITEIEKVQRRTTKPVGTAEPWHIWLDHPELANAVDFIGVQLLPYWEGVEADKAVLHLLNRLVQIQNAYPGKPVVVTEIGWPSAGRAIGGARASQVNQAKVLREFLVAAEARNLDYFIIEAFDQPWKISFEGLAGGYWGLSDIDRQPKFAWTGPIRERDDWLSWALIAALIGLFPALHYAGSRPTLQWQGAALFGTLTQASGSVLVWALLPAISLYLSATELAIWATLFTAAWFLIIGVFIDFTEAADLIWTGPLTRRFTPAQRKTSKDKCSKISIHVPICNEPPKMLRRTLTALAKLDYPNFEVIVLDNNTSDDSLWRPVQAHCETLGDRFHFHHYDALAGFKGGALNCALSHTAADADFIAVIDSDYIVAPDWLNSLVPFFDDPAIGFVQAPQDYRDERESSFKRFCFWEYAGFFRIGMVRRNEADAIIQHGTMTIIRRTALTEVGGWAEWCITEDAELGLRLQHEGWQSAYVNQSFGKGITPDSLDAYKAQRFRWAYGAMQILKQRWRWLITGRDTKLNRTQRIHYLTGWLPWFADAAGLLFAAGAVAWTASLIFWPETTELPPAIFLAPTLAAVFLRQWRLFRLYGLSDPCHAADRVKAALAGLALSHTVAKAMISGLLTARRPFLRTPKYRRGPQFLRGLLMASEEAIILCCIGAVAAGFLMTNHLWHLDAFLWLAVLVTLALPYSATVAMAVINGLPSRASKRARLSGAPQSVPAYPPSERRTQRP